MNAKVERLGRGPRFSISARIVASSSSSGVAAPASSASAASRLPDASTALRLFELSPDWDEWASSTITAKRLPGSDPISSAITGNFWSVVTMIRLPDSSACRSCREVRSMFSTTPSVCSNWLMASLKLAVQDAAVGDDDDGIEDRAVLGVVQRGQLVREPGDGEALAAPGGVLDQVAPARAVAAGVGDHAPDGVELLVAREDQAGRSPAVVVLVLDFVNELADQIEDAVARPDLVPEVVRGVSAPGGRDGGIAGAAELAAVEGQEAGLRASELRGDEDPVRVDREVGETAAVGEERLAGVRSFRYCRIA